MLQKLPVPCAYATHSLPTPNSLSIENRKSIFENRLTFQRSKMMRPGVPLQATAIPGTKAGLIMAKRMMQSITGMPSIREYFALQVGACPPMMTGWSWPII